MMGSVCVKEVKNQKVLLRLGTGFDDWEISRLMHQGAEITAKSNISIIGLKRNH